jgi:hypothetical protein
MFSHILKILLLLSGLNAWSTNSISYSKQWTVLSYFGHYDKLLYYVEPQLRLANVKGTYEQFLYNTGIGTAINQNWQLWIGQTISDFSSTGAKAEDVVGRDNAEYRLWQQISFFYPSSAVLAFDLRSRIEERYSLEFAPWALRLRERPTLFIPLTEHQSIYISDELFFNLKSVAWVPTKTLDQNRLYLGVMQKLNQNSRFTVSYLNQYINKITPEKNHGIVISLVFQY